MSDVVKSTRKLDEAVSGETGKTIRRLATKRGLKLNDPTMQLLQTGLVASVHTSSIENQVRKGIDRSEITQYVGRAVNSIIDHASKANRTEIKPRDIYETLLDDEELLALWPFSKRNKTRARKRQRKQ